MKFDDIPATDNDKKSGSKGNNSLFMPILIVCIIIVAALVAYSIATSSNNNEVVKLDPNSRLVQSLYTSVHDFKSTSPYWMYEGENSNSIANMTESNKLVLAYLNLKASDFLQPDNCAILRQETPYGKLVCSDKGMIKREDVERSYKEVFGDKVTINTAVHMKVNPKSEVYIYDAEQDAYFLYSLDDGSNKFEKSHNYNYRVYQAERIGDTIRVYEELSIEKISTGAIVNQSKYIYTFVLSDDGLYSYTSIEKIA